MTNAIKTLLQMQNGFLQLESTLYEINYICERPVKEKENDLKEQK
jgi:hypothetical protein